MLKSPSEEVLAGLRAHGPAAVLPPVFIELGSKYEERILNSPANFPLEWVLAAEQRVSRDAGNEPLEKVAADHNWFSL
jgi:hypothetical protein